MKIKKIFILVICLAMITAVISGCAKNDDKNKTPDNEQGEDIDSNDGNNEPNDETKEIEGTLEEILQRIFDGLDESEQVPMNETFILSKDMEAEGKQPIENFLGKNAKDINFTEGLASEALISTHAYSLVLLRTANIEDANKAIELIKDDTDLSRKWICTGIEPDEVVYDNIGNLVFVLIVKNELSNSGNIRGNLHDSFKKLAG